jgi:hypothetical protein
MLALESGQAGDQQPHANARDECRKRLIGHLSDDDNAVQVRQ